RLIDRKGQEPRRGFRPSSRAARQVGDRRPVSARFAWMPAADCAGFQRLGQEAGGSAVEIKSLRRYLDSWPGVGSIERGMVHQGYDLRLTRYEQGWRATFYTSGIEHSPTSAEGTE